MCVRLSLYHSQKCVQVYSTQIMIWDEKQFSRLRGPSPGSLHKRLLFDELFHRKPLILDRWPVISPLLLMARTRHHPVTRPVGA
jgi:hypothetical protein